MPAPNLDDVLSFVAETLRRDEKQIRRIAMALFDAVVAIGLNPEQAPYYEGRGLLII